MLYHEGSPVSADEYRQNAAKCLELADNSTEHGTRLGLMEMAQAWLRLSEQAEKNSRSEYETPARSDCTAMQ
jgi:hypothetical protein